MTELVDVYDANRQLLNRTIDRKKTIQKSDYIVIVHLILMDKLGNLLIQQRSKNKSLWPNLWDISCSGAPIAGETSAEGIIRELKEELSITLNSSNIRPVLTANFTNGFSDYYIYEIDTSTKQSICFEPTEIQTIRWVTKDQLYNLIADNQFVPYKIDFLKALFACYDNFSEIKF